MLSTTYDAIRLNGNTSGTAPYVASYLNLNSNIDARGRGMFLTSTANEANSSWFVGVPYNGSGFQIGKASTNAFESASGPYIRSNAALFIDTSGNVGIGTTSPGYASGVINLTVGSPTTSGFLNLDSPTANPGQLRFWNNGTLEDELFAASTGTLTLYNTIGGYVLNITNAGNVGIGTTAPGAKLDLSIGGGSGPWTTGSWGRGVQLSNGNVLKWAKGATYAYGIGQTSDQLYFMRSTADNASAVANYDMVITGAGNVGIGSVNPSGQLDVRNASVDTQIANGVYGVLSNGEIYTKASLSGNWAGWIQNTSSTYGLYVGNTDPSPTWAEIAYSNYGLETNGDIYASIPIGSPPGRVGLYVSSFSIGSWGGEIMNTADQYGLYVSNFLGYYAEIADGTYGILTNGYLYSAYGTCTGSDQRLKKDILPLTNALDKVERLNGVTFRWKKDDHKDIGLIAQNVEKVLPEIVHTGPDDGMKSVEYDHMAGLFVEAIKEQQKEIKDQQKEIEKLEKKLGGK